MYPRQNLIGKLVDDHAALTFENVVEVNIDRVQTIIGGD